MPAVKRKARPGAARNRRKRAPVRAARTVLRIVLPVAAVAAVGGAGLWLAVSDEGTRLIAGAGEKALDLSARAGLRVDHVLVSGRQRVSKRDVERALGARRGMPIVAFDPYAAKARLEKLAWVRRATVERRLPDTIFIRIDERRPLALWQLKGKLALIDGEGAVITRSKLARYRHMPLVVGAGAAPKAAAIIGNLRAHPRVGRLVGAIVRVGERRWDLKFKNGIVARLPERGTARALATLDRLIQRERILKRGVVAIDLRFADRLVVRTVAPVEPGAKAPEDRHRPHRNGPSKDT
ncbi:MAG: FtsQ-type POTRA domain-containing protein [Alphaproteobacteria bacterium]|nr:FtsQ-type POTRA domain-containing protein [Alphaproteobacteria bacterium]